eukprot:1157510-Pelagomonas_calceolata.AAC.2
MSLLLIGLLCVIASLPNRRACCSALECRTALVCGWSACAAYSTCKSTCEVALLVTGQQGGG